MVKQLYEQSILQDLLGLPRYRPPASHGPSGAGNTPHRDRSRQAVEKAWGVDLEDSDRHLMPYRRASPDMDEESRYSTRYPRKRRRVDNGRQQDTVFVEASEDEAVMKPQVQRATSASRASREETRDEKVEARRVYWASKGMSGGGYEESD